MGFEKVGIEIQARDVWRKDAVEGFFFRFKERTKRFGTGFCSGALLILYRVGLRVLWHSITTGGVNLTAPIFRFEPNINISKQIPHSQKISYILH